MSSSRPRTADLSSHARIGYVLKRFPRLSETFVLNEMLELERQGLPIEVFSLKRPLDEPRHPLLPELHAKVTYVSAEADCAAVEVDRASRLASHLSPAKHGLEREALARKALSIGHLARERGLQHLHAHFASDATTAAAIAAQAAGIRYSFTAHARDIFHSYTSPEVDDAARRRKILASRFVVTVSEFNLRHLQALAGPATADRVVRIYNGIDVGRFAPALGTPTGSRTILCVGRLVPKKGIGDLIEACRILRLQGLEFDCQIIGEGPLRATFAEQIAAADLTRVVTLHGAREPDDVLAAMHRARVLALPCIVDATGDRDGLPTVLLEALAAGVPAISTRVAGVPEIIEHGVSGLLVEPYSPEALADALAQVLDDTSLAHRLAVAGRERARLEFDLARNVVSLRRLLEDAVRTAPSYDRNLANGITHWNGVDAGDQCRPGGNDHGR